jgi:ribonuclease Z
MSLSIKILGCGSALPTTLRNATAQIIKHNERPYLVDCAESTQVQMRKYSIKFAAINHIFISHLHGDHFYGIFGLLSSFSLMGRTGEIYLHCPERLQQMLESQYSPLDVNELGFKLIFVPLIPNEVNLTYENKNLEVYSVPLKHRIPTWGFIFKEKIKERNIIKEVIQKYNLSIAEIVKIKNGCELMLENGTIIPNSELTTDPPHPKSYACITDTVKLNSVAEAVKGVDVLYHEATYDSSLTERAKETFHTTTIQAAEIAKTAGVGKLIIGHFSSRYHSTEELEKQAQTVFPNTVCAEDGMEINI